MCVLCFSLVLYSTTHHWVQLMLEINQGGNPFALAETGIKYQYTHAKRMILSLSQILVLISHQSNSGQSLSTTDPQPPPYSTYGIRGFKWFCKSRSNSSTRAYCMIRSGGKQTYVLWLVEISRLIESRRSNRSSNQVRAKVVCRRTNDCSTTRVPS